MEEPTRNLTAAEQKRRERFCATEERLKSEGYTPHNLTVSIIQANLLGTLIAAIPCIPFIVAYFYLNRTISELSQLQWLIFIVIFVALIAVHEAIHGLFWSFGAQNGLKDIEFGFIVKYLTPYCTCSSPLKKTSYIIGTFMPMFLLGICVMLAAVIMGNQLMMILGVVNTLAGAGDILVILKLLSYKTKGKDIVIIDHPYEAGLVVFER